MNVNWLGQSYDLNNIQHIKYIDSALRRTNIYQLSDEVLIEYVWTLEVLIEEVIIASKLTTQYDTDLTLLAFEADKIRDGCIREIQSR